MTRVFMTVRERRRMGAMVGLAVGDALGAAVEFKKRGTFAPVTGFRAGGPHGLGPGEWTDDTSMALALADSLAFHGFDHADQGRRYLAWWREGNYSVNGRCFDIGIATREALARIADGADAATAGDAADGKSGNGSIMRLAPIAIHYLELFPENVSLLASHAAASSAPTHRSAKCLSACSYLAVVLAALMSGRDRDEVLSPDWPMLDELQRHGALHPAILDVARGSFRRKPASEIRGSGYVVDSLEAALWAFHEAATFEEAVLAAVNLGDDADTTGAVCGQLAGAFFGVDGIPAEWIDGLARREWLTDATARLGVPEVSPRPSAEAAAPSYVVTPGETKSTKTAARLADARHPPPTSRCYWVLPGRLLAGAYPGSAEPNAHEARIAQLCDAGIQTFVTLMEENERSPTGAALVPYADVIRARSDAHPQRRTEQLLRFPVRDLSVPTIEEMRAILDAIDLSLEERRPVYVHCLGGIGRTGTVVGCWLRRHGHASRDDVLSVLARLRVPDVERANRPSPETAAQREMVLGWTE
jgi:ADP-ribosyl-[dinitrogen reductase] hydrolase